jgi:hypothetical protein
MSGFNSTALATASLPVAASPQIFQSRCYSSNDLTPRRKRLSSSAIRMRRVGMRPSLVNSENYENGAEYRN